MRSLAALFGLLSIVISTPLRAEVVYDGVVGGSVLFSDDQYTCSDVPAGSCTACWGTSTAVGPGIRWGKRALGGAYASGNISGSISLFATLDGVALGPGLLPRAGYFQNLLFSFEGFCSTCCSGHYSVGSSSGAMVLSGTVPITVPVSQAASTPFAFDICNLEVCWGTACGFIGSGDYRWKYYSPGPTRAQSFSAGDPPPAAFGGIDVALDITSSPGGRVSATKVAGVPPDPLPPPQATPFYWEILTDIPAGSMTADLVFSYDPSQITVAEANLHVAVFDTMAAAWRALPSVVDEANNTVRVSGVGGLGTFILVDASLLDVPDLATTRGFRIGPVSPNPTTGAIGFVLSLRSAANVDYGLYDPQGRLVAKMRGNSYGAGDHRVQWSIRDAGRRIPGGRYVLKATSGSAQASRAVVIVR